MTERSQQFAGEVIKSLGSGLLVIFKSAQQTVNWAIAVQQVLQKQAEDLPPLALCCTIRLEFTWVISSNAKLTLPEMR